MTYPLLHVHPEFYTVLCTILYSVVKWSSISCYCPFVWVRAVSTPVNTHRNDRCIIIKGASQYEMNFIIIQSESIDTKAFVPVNVT